MTTILLTIILIKLTGASAWWAALVLPLAAVYEFVRLSVLFDIQRKATEAALKADEARTFALGAALESRRVADAFAPAPPDNPCSDDDPAAAQFNEPAPPVLKTSPDLVGPPERPHNL